MLNTVYQDLKPINEEHGSLLLNSMFGPGVSKQQQEEQQTLLNSQQQTSDDLDKSEGSEDILDKIHQTNKKKNYSFEDMLVTEDDLDQSQQDKNRALSGIEDSRYTKFYFQKYMVIEISSFLFALSSIAFSIIEYDLRVKKPGNDYSPMLLNMISMMSLIIIIFIIISYNVELKLMKEQKLITDRDTLNTTGKSANLIFEIAIILVHPNILTHDTSIDLQNKLTMDYVTYQLNDFLGIFTLFRMYLIIRVLLNSTMYASTRAFRICRMYGTEGGFFYAAKCLMDQTPLKSVIIVFGLSLLILGHGLRVCEEPMMTYVEDHGMNFGYYWNCFWCIIITMTTVGYGDYYPATLPGRIVIFITSIWGVFLVSMMVVALTNTLKMDISESKTYNVIQRLKVRKHLMESSAWVLTSAARFSQMHKRKQLTKKEKFRQKVAEIKSHTENFKIVNRKIKRMYDVSNISEEVARHFDFLKDELKVIADNQLLLKDYLLKLKSNGTINNNEVNDQLDFLKQFKEEEKEDIQQQNYV